MWTYIFLVLVAILFSSSSSVASSSISCTYLSGNRFCILEDVCYRAQSQEILFEESNESCVRWPIRDLTASSISNHSGLLVDVTVIPDGSLEQVKSSAAVVYLNHTLLVRRFHSGNLFHVFHDDLLPTLATLSLIKENVSVLFMDDLDSNYKSFYTDSNLFDSYFAQSRFIYCVDRMYVGLSRRTLWYQYGFARPQSPLLGTHISSVRKLQSVLKSSFISEDEPVRVYQRTCIILVRNENRKILNLEDLQIWVKNIIDCEVHAVALNGSNIRQIIKIISKSQLLIAMHGAELALSLFLPDGAAVLEMFPYAVPAENYQPYRTLCKLLGIKYVSWQNTFEDLTITHPERPAEFGGIVHLPETLRREILNNKLIPYHLCCGNPFWLFRIYQDTIVDSNSFSQSLRNVYNGKCNRKDSLDYLLIPTRDFNILEAEKDVFTFLETSISVKKSCSTLVYPGAVRDIHCVRINANQLLVQWKPPFNSIFYSDISLRYELIVDCEALASAVLYKTKESFAKLTCSSSARIWVSAIFAENVPGRANVHPILC